MVKPHDGAVGRKPHRTPVACRRCNSRKVKCTASVQVPCSGCDSAGVECILIDSQRGKYRRRGRVGSTEAGPEQNRSAAADTFTEIENRGQDKGSSRLVPPSRPESPGAFYAQIAQQSLETPQPVAHRASQPVFLGEAFSLTYVLHDVLAPFLADTLHFQRRLHFPLITNRPLSSRADLVVKQTRHLEQHGLWFRPSQPVLDSLLACYFDDFHPAFPIFSRSDFLNAVAQKEASLIVLNAVLMIAVTICDDELLCGSEGPSRHALRRLYYQQAKSLYDADMEPDKFESVTGVFLMSFWWDGPNDEKDSWHWLGVATSLAQSLGMHRSMQYSSMNRSKVRAWRRLWWSIRVRDTLVSGSIGRPQHFSGLSCDVELPSVDDVREAIGEDVDEKVIYSVEMAKLSVIFSDILTSRYNAHGVTPATQNREALETSLDRFREEIHSALKYNGVSQDKRGLWSVTLLMALNYATILLCRPPRSMSGLEQTAQWGNTSKAINSANEITRAMEDVLSASITRICQIHTIPALFNALAMHIWALCTSSDVGRELAENRCRTCMLGLSVMQESWPVGGWVYRLFASIMTRLKARSGSTSRHEGTGRPAVAHMTPGQAHPSCETGQIGHGSSSQVSYADNPVYTMEPREDQGFPRHTSQQNWWEVQQDVIASDFIPDMFLIGDPDQNLHLDQGDFFDMLNGLH